MKIIVGVIVKEDNKVLMVQEAKKKVYGLWNMPAGHLDEKENIFIGAKREFKEETGYEVELTGMLPIVNFVDGEEHVIIMNFYGKIIGGEIYFDKEEVLDVKWISIHELKAMSDKELRGYNQKRSMIESIEKGISYPLEIIKNII